MKAINHLVLAGHDLDAMRSHYQGLGFTVTPRGQHPFGTGNALVQLHGTYLELLAVTIPQDVPEHRIGQFSFAAFNRDYLARHEGFSMLVLDTADARADIAAWRAAGLQTYEPFDFSRTAKMPDGQEITVGFSLAFVSHPAAPWLGLFACQHYSPHYFEQPRYLQHGNGAMKVQDVWIVGETAADLAGFIQIVTGAKLVTDGSSSTMLQTRTGAIVLAGPAAFERAFGLAPPHPQDGPHLAGFTVACRDLKRLTDLPQAGHRHVLAASKNFGTAIGFVETRDGHAA
jgi:glyoxalase-like protein